ncbi:extracellular solute-binding protein [Isoptericola sp. NPDC057653]|uniref:ABC transporter substrate-binding protein n=1 Tax=Isoptericola sp. NPDC057653 TaxID=3346195 RepID=UPI0036773279
MGSKTTAGPPPRVSRRSFLAGAAGVLAAVPLAACAAPGGSGATRTEITFYEQKQEVIAYFDDLLRRFQGEHPGIRVVHDSTTAIAPQFVRGEPGDVGCFNDNLELARYISRGQMGDLSGLPSAARVRTDISGLTDQYATYPGRTSVLPYSLAAAGVIYNKAIFAKHELPVPTTWTEFVEVCTALQKAGITPVYATDRDTWTLWQGLFDYSVGSLVDTGAFFGRMNELGTDVGPDSDVSFSTTLAVPMERARTISTFFNPDHAVRSYADGNLAFGKGQAAMYLQGPWALSQIAMVDDSLDVGTFALPVSDDPDERQVRVNIDLGLYIPAATPHRAEAEQLVEFLMQPEIINAYNADNLAYSTLTDAPTQQDDRLAGLQSYVDDAAFYQGAGTFVPTSIPLGNYLQTAIRTGNFDAMLAQLDADWRRLAGRAATV